MNVFVLCTGRTASTTFAKACSHISGFTAGHETRSDRLFAERMTYPDNHIEVDNRLVFFLGALQERYGDEAYYVHLTRDNESVARSYRKRWYYRGSIVRCFYSNVLMIEGYNKKKMEEACRFYIDNTESNIRNFLKDKSNTFNFRVEHASEDFHRMLEWIGADCSDEGHACWLTNYNTNRKSILRERLKIFGGRVIRVFRAIPTIYRDM